MAFLKQSYLKWEVFQTDALECERCGATFHGYYNVDGTFELKLCQACDAFLNADFDPCASSCCSDEVDEDDE